MSANKKTVMKYMEGFNETNHAKILSCLTEDVVWELPGVYLHKGKAAFDKEIENEAFTGSPIIRINRLTEENNIVIAEGTVQAKRKDGVVMNLVFCDVFEMKAGLIKKLTSYLLLFEGVQIIDFTGPFEVLGQAGYEVITVSANPSVKTNMGMKVNPDFTFTNCPEAGIFIIPGGDISKTRQSPEAIQWIKQYSERSDVVMSVCNGALILAQTGLLDGLTATTYHKALPQLAKDFPKVKVVSDQRFIDNGKFITTAGLSSGMDGALHIVKKLKGKPKAQTVALNLEYDWKPGDNYARAALADKYLYKIFEGDDEGHPAISSVKLLNTEGDKEQWKVEFEFTASITAEEIEKVMEKMIIKKVNWKKEKNILPTESSWSFTSQEKEKWNGSLEVKGASSNTDKFIVILKVDKSKV